MLSVTLCFAGNPSYVHWTMDQCYSNINDGSNYSYEEFIPDIFNSQGCSQLSMVTPNLYRNHPDFNPHSCTVGVNGSVAMCVNAYAGCFFQEDLQQAIRFDILVNPDPSGQGRLSGLEFFELAPEEFSYLNGISGPNNYPTKYAVRIEANGVQVFLQEDIPTTQAWTLETFDFSNQPGFIVNQATTFSFEILPYCYVGNGYGTHAWDIDEIKVTSACGDGITIGGNLTTNQGETSTNLCINGTGSNSVSFSLTGAHSQLSTYVITDAAGTILSFPGAGPTFDFSNAGVGVCQIWHIAHEGSLNGATVGANIQGITGCLDFSNPVTVTREMAMPGVVTSNGITEYIICSNTDNTIIPASVTGNIGAFNYWVLTDGSGNVLEVNTGPPFDVSPYTGLCYIYNLSADVATSAPSVGQNLSSIPGCVGLSNPITINKFNVTPSSITTSAGLTTHTVCSGSASGFLLDVNVSGGNGGEVWIITDMNGVIQEVQPSAPIDLSNINLPQCLLYLVRSSGNLTNFGIGLPVSEVGGCIETSNPISITKTNINASTITSNGASSIELCGQNGMASNIPLESVNGVGTSKIYVMTDEVGNIVALPTGPPFDFGSLGEGVYLLYEYFYEDQIFGATVGGSITTITGCAARSNGITVRISAVNAGTITTPDGTGTFAICDGVNASMSLTPTLTGNTGSGSQWLITDSNNNILEVQSLPLSFANINQPLCYVYHMSSLGSTNLGIGVNTADLTGCLELSNQILVDKTEVVAGSISVNGQTSLSICIGNSSMANFEVTTTAPTANTVTYLITDANGDIIANQAGTSFDLSNAGSGTCTIYQLASSGAVSGATTGSNISGLGGCYDLSNPITVIREMIVAGTVTSPIGNICLATDNAVVSFSLTGQSGGSGQWLITDSAGILITTSSSPTIDFNTLGAGFYNIYYLNSNGSAAGLTVGQSISNITGCFGLSNAVSVSVEDVNPSTISSSLGSNITVCVGDGVSDFVDVTATGGTGSTSAWFITDANGNILSLPAAPPFDFDAAGFGACQIWNVNYGSITGLAVGQNASNLGGCFALSNPITVNRTSAVGGSLVFPDNTIETSICVGDGVPDPLNVILTGNSGDNFQWLITDVNGVILDLPTAPPFDFETAGPGVCLIWNLSYSGNLTGATIGANASGLGGCFDLSNPLTVTRNQVEGGSITTNNGTDVYVCVNDGVDDFIDVTLTGNIGGSRWIITDASGTIIDLPAGPPFNFETAGIGTCQIWHLSSEGGIGGLAIGENANALSGCIDLSNPITVYREEAVAGTLVLATGGTTTSICSGDGQSDIVDVNLTGNAGSGAWVITDASGLILDLPGPPPYDFEGVDVGECLIWHLSFAGNVTGATIGANVSNITGCFEFSNPVTVTKLAVDGGTLDTSFGSILSICVGDGVPDPIDVSLTGNVGAVNQWVITDANGIIIDLPSGPPFDFEGTGVGVCLIRNLSYETVSGAVVGSNIVNLAGCFDLSNTITVNRTSAEGGSLTLLDGTTEATYCIFNNNDVIVDVVLTGNSGDNCEYIITNKDGLIIAKPTSAPFDLTNTGLDECQIYNICYGDGIAGLDIDWPISALQGCFDLSNPIIINKDVADAGTITTVDGDILNICASDGVSDAFIIQQSNFIGQFGEYIITDTNGNILGVQQSNVIDLEGSSIGTCYVYCVAWNGPLDGDFVGSNLDALSGCFDISNRITVVKDGLLGGTLTTDLGIIDLTICSGDGHPDEFGILLNGNTSSHVQGFLVTNAAGDILSIPTGPTFDFEGTGPETCFLYAISYVAGLNGYVTGGSIAGLMGCFALSNPITITKNFVSGGTISFDGGAPSMTICAGDGIPDPIDLIVTDQSGATCDIVVTNLAGDIEIIAHTMPVDLDDAKSTSCLIYQVCYNEPMDFYFVGFNIAKWTTCHSLSNSLLVEKDVVSGGVLLTSPGGASMVDVCVGDGIPDEIDVVVTGSGSSDGTWLITDGDGIIEMIPSGPPFDFEGSDEGVCNIIFVDHTSLGGAAVGNDIDDLTGCFDLSTSIVVNKTEVGAGVVTFSTGTTDESVCVGDGQADVLSFAASGAVANYAWVVTDNFGLILAVPGGTSFDFEGSAAGSCRIYGISYTGTFIGEVGGNVFLAMSTQCYQISSPLTVNKFDSGGPCLAPTPENGLVAFDVYPNPARDVITIDIATMPEGEMGEILIYNQLGELVEKVMIDGLNKYVDLDISQYNNGAYLIRLGAWKTAEIKRFIKID